MFGDEIDPQFFVRSPDIIGKSQIQVPLKTDVARDIGFEGNLDLRFADYIGRSDKELWIDFVAKHKLSHTLEELLAMKRRLVIELIRSERPLFEGLPALVEKLAASFQLALASGSERAVVDEVLQLQGLRRFFAATVSGSDI